MLKLLAKLLMPLDYEERLGQSSRLCLISLGQKAGSVINGVSLAKEVPVIRRLKIDIRSDEVSLVAYSAAMEEADCSVLLLWDGSDYMVSTLLTAEQP